VCAVLAGGMWPRALSALSGLLARSSGETLTLQLLKVSSGKAPGVLHLDPAEMRRLGHSMNTKQPCACTCAVGVTHRMYSFYKVFHEVMSLNVSTLALQGPCAWRHHQTCSGIFGRVRTHDFSVPDCSAGAQGYQSFTQAAGLLGLVEARDAFLSSLCAFTLGSGAADDPTSPSGNRGDPSSPHLQACLLACMRHGVGGQGGTAGSCMQTGPLSHCSVRVLRADAGLMLIVARPKAVVLLTGPCMSSEAAGRMSRAGTSS